MLEDGIKWIITKIAGFFGFDEAAVGETLGSFSIFGTIKECSILESLRERKIMRKSLHNAPNALLYHAPFQKSQNI